VNGCASDEVEITRKKSGEQEPEGHHRRGVERELGRSRGDAHRSPHSTPREREHPGGLVSHTRRRHGAACFADQMRAHTLPEADARPRAPKEQEEARAPREEAQRDREQSGQVGLGREKCDHVPRGRSCPRRDEERERKASRRGEEHREHGPLPEGTSRGLFRFFQDTLEPATS
jgi:hypothetical protein